LCGILVLLHASWAYSAATAASAVGDVKVAAPGAAPAALAKGAAVASGATVTTGPTGRAILRFDDGQVVAVHGDTTFRIDEYRFDAQKPEADKGVFSLLKGAIRALTGALGARNPRNVAFRAPQATIGIRGTDFVMATVNPLFLGPSAGTLVVGTAEITKGYAQVLAVGGPLQAIEFSALPPLVQAWFTELIALNLAAFAGGVAEGAGQLAGGLTAEAVLPWVAALIAGGLILTSDDDDGDQATTSHHSTTTHHP
jgi:hypothetical protein